jgi:RND family efflux transporter MFP subunit
VHTAPVEAAVWPRRLAVNGEALPSESALLAAQVPGQLVAWHVERGQRVAAGQLLVEIDPVEYGLRVEQARAALLALRAELGLDQAPETGGEATAVEGFKVDETPIVREALAGFRQAELDRQRAEALRSDGITSAGDLDAALLREETAASRLRAARDTVAVRRARLAEQQVALELALESQRRARVVAPFDGAVAERRAGLGEILSVGALLLELVRFDPLRVRLVIPEQDAGRVAIGQRVDLTLDSVRELSLTGSLLRLAPALDGASRTLWAELELENPSGALRPGSFVRAAIEFDPQHRALWVPEEALVRFAGTVRAFAIEDGRAVERRPSLGRERTTPSGARQVEVLAGLEEGERLVLSPGGLGAGTPLTEATPASDAAAGRPAGS